MKNNSYSRAAVFGYRLRFSPETQPIRQTVIDHLVLKNLRESDRSDGESVGRLTSIKLDGTEIANLPLNEVKTSLPRLEKEGLVASQLHRGKMRWIITDAGIERLARDHSVISGLIDSTLEQLFGKNPPPGTRECFLSCLSLVFDRLAKSYVETIASGKDTTVLSDTLLDPIVERVLREHPEVPRANFRAALGRFFRESTPQFDSLKWTFCQNYYLVRAIGLGEGSDVLSTKLFEGASFYLDTNVVIVALDPTSPHHESLKQVLNSLTQIGCRLYVLEPSIEELRSVAVTQGDKLEKVLAQIPDALLAKVSGIVARAEARHRENPSVPSPKEMLKRFEDPKPLLLKTGVEVVTDPWFEEHTDNDEIKTLASRLRSHYDATTPGRRKTAAAALHDALALKWIHKRCGSGKNAHFLTFDASLPSLPTKVCEFAHTAKLALSVYAVLPWLGAVVMTDREDVPQVYSALLVAQLLTMGTRFSLNEFRLLAELEMECRNLPADDVEQCLLYLRREARGLDVSKAEDREKLHHVVKGFFASPDRKYIAEVSALRDQLEKTRGEVEKLRNQHERDLQESREATAEHRTREIKARTLLRLLLVGVIFATLLVTCILVAHEYGNGKNLLQKIGSVWWLFGLTTAAAFALARWLCRGELWAQAIQYLSLLRDT